MKSIGIICEYNPFHNGHLYHINKIKEMYPDYKIILVMSGHFLERGDVSIINKWHKTEIALNFGIDLIIELPFVFASQSADIFAYGAISILNYLKVEKIVFGSECNDIEKLKTVASITETIDFKNNLKNYLDQGYSYPKALDNAFKKSINFSIDSPNDLLGISYIKAINKLNSNIEPVCIQRTNDYNSKNTSGKISSATSIRENLKNNKPITNFIPKYVEKYINNISLDDYFDLLKYKIISENDLSIFNTVDEGIENRIKKYIFKVNNLEELIEKVKTKRYTYNKIKRMLVHILCGFTKKQANNLKEIRYIRVLGFNQNGRNYLNKIKKEIEIPIITNYSDIKDEMLELEFKVNGIYASIFKEKNYLSELEYKHKPVIK